MNHRYEHPKHLFEGWLNASLAEQDRHGLRRIVKGLGAYPHSSRRAYRGWQPMLWLKTDCVLGHFASRAAQARPRYAKFINEGKTEGRAEIFYGGEAGVRVGDERSRRIGQQWSGLVNRVVISI